MVVSKEHAGISTRQVHGISYSPAQYQEWQFGDNQLKVIPFSVPSG